MMFAVQRVEDALAAQFFFGVFGLSTRFKHVDSLEGYWVLIAVALVGDPRITNCNPWFPRYRIRRVIYPTTRRLIAKLRAGIKNQSTVAVARVPSKTWGFACETAAATPSQGRCASHPRPANALVL